MNEVNSDLDSDLDLVSDTISPATRKVVQNIVQNIAQNITQSIMQNISQFIPDLISVLDKSNTLCETASKNIQKLNNENHIKDEGLFTRQEFCDKYRVSKSTLYNWAKLGYVRKVSLTNQRTRFVRYRWADGVHVLDLACSNGIKG